jgi:hypothetical protein
MTVLITLTSAGVDAGPFDLYSDTDGYVTPFATGILKATLLGGYTSSAVPNGTTSIRIVSTGTCTNFIYVSVEGTTTTTTSTSSTSSTTTTTTTTIAPIMAYWYAEKILGCPNNATYAVYKNSILQASGVLGANASGSFAVVVGDIVEIENTSAANGVGCDEANANIFRNSNPTAVATDTQSGYGASATATFTITAGTTIVELYAGPVSA